MSYIAPLPRHQAEPAIAATLDAIQKKIGMVPNLYLTLARSPAALNGLLGLNDAIAGGQLNAREREIVALATSQANGCQYCLSAHTLLGKHAGLSPEQALQARAGKGSEPREAALAQLARDMVEQRGHISATQLDSCRSAGLSESELLEVVTHVAATVLTNYTNNIARTAIDFPTVSVDLVA